MPCPCHGDFFGTPVGIDDQRTFVRQASGEQLAYAPLLMAALVVLRKRI
jgi:hypothetical protein